MDDEIPEDVDLNEVGAYLETQIAEAKRLAPEDHVWANRLARLERLLALIDGPNGKAHVGAVIADAKRRR